MKNIIFIVNIDSGQDTRSQPYHYSIKSWQKWASNNNAEVFLLTEKVYEGDYMHLNWHKSLALKLLKENNIDYDQVLIVDADTIVHPDCPNFFEMTDNKLCGVEFDGSWDWVLRGIENYSRYIFDGYMMPWEKYFDCGFIIVNKTHRQFFQDIVNFYFTYQDNLIKLQQTFFNGTDQTPVNMLVHRKIGRASCRERV